MVINEKALVRQMKEAYKTGGYTVAVLDGRMMLTNGHWLANIDEGNVPSGLLGMLAEHIRDVPKEGDAFNVIKTKDGPFVQTRILEDAVKSLQHMRTQRDAEWDEPNPPMMVHTPLTYKGMQLWQGFPGKEIYMIDPRYSAMIDTMAEDVWKVGNGLYIKGEISELWVLRVTEGEAVEKLHHLEAIAWAK